MTMLAAYQAVLSGVGIVAIVVTLRVNANAVAAMTVQTESSKLSERAYLLVNPAGTIVSRESKEMLRVETCVVNAGRTGALLKATRFSFNFGIDALATFLERYPETSREGEIVPPDGEWRFVIRVPELPCAVVGCITYNDVFGGSHLFRFRLNVLESGERWLESDPAWSQHT